MINDFVDDLVTIFGNFSTYSSLKAPKIYTYEKNTFEHMPSLVILPISTDVTAQEAGGEILQSSIMAVLWWRYKQKTLPDQLYDYEVDLRKTVWNQKLLNNRYFRVTLAEYGMSQTAGSVTYKPLILTIIARDQYNYV